MNNDKKVPIEYFFELIEINCKKHHGMVEQSSSFTIYTNEDGEEEIHFGKAEPSLCFPCRDSINFINKALNDSYEYKTTGSTLD